MMRILLCLLTLPLLAGAAPDAWDMQRLKTLGAKIPAHADQGDFLVALAGTAASQGSDADWKAQDYDDLYALLQKYRDELKNLGMEKDKYDKLLLDLRARSEALKKRLDLLKPLDGLKIHGQIHTYYDDVYSGGQGAGALQRGHFRHAVQRAELQMTYTRGLLRGLVDYDFQYIFGNQYDGPASIGVEQNLAQSGMSQGSRQIYVELLAPLQIRLGTFDYRQTPLTFWRNEDPDPYVPEPFGERRQRLRQDLLLKDDNRYVLRGLRLLSDPDFGGHGIHFAAALSQLGTSPSSGNLTTPGANRIYQAAGTPPVDFLEVYNTYLGAWSLHYSSPGNWLDFGVQGTTIGDVADTDNYKYAFNPNPAKVGQPIETFSSSVNSVSASLNPAPWLSLNGEYAMSSFLAPALGIDPAVNGAATTADLHLNFGWMGLRGRYVQVNKDFVSAPAQGHTWDPNLSPMGPLETENSLYDPMSDGFSDLRAPRPPETIYNRRILPPAYWYVNGTTVSPSSARLPYDPAVNAMDPYGLATPNRARYGGSLDVTPFGEGAIISADYDLAAQIEGTGTRAVETYTRMGIGSKIDLQKVLSWPFRLSGSYGVESTRNADWVAFDSGKLQGGIEYDAWEGGTLQFGWRHLDFNGVLAYDDPRPFSQPDPTLLAFGRRVQDKSYEQWAFGLRQRFGDDLALWINYGALTFSNAQLGQLNAAIDSRGPFRLEEGYARLSLSF